MSGDIVKRGIIMRNKILLGVSVFNLLLYMAMQSIWSGIEGMLGVGWLQYLILGLLVATVMVLLFPVVTKTKKNWVWIPGALAIALFGALAYMFYLGIGSLHYILRSFIEYTLILFGVSFVLYLFFYFPKTRLWANGIFRITIMAFMIVVILVVGFLTNNVMISTHPTVFVVEDEYQIVWTTSIDSTGIVKIGDDTYVDTYSGSADSFTKVHKVSVPMSVLDSAGAYEIESTNYIYRGPYSGLAGRTVTESHTFRPVDLTDGIQIYTIADAHEYVGAASKTGTYFGDDLDLLVMDGDIASFLEEESDIKMIHKIAYNITQGSRPVVYARGNHEVKGEWADELYKYVGSKNESFYFTFNLSGIFGIVLDLGEDHPDDWWEFYGTAYFTEYRNEQTAFLNDILASGEYNDPSVLFRLVVCHMPITNVYSDTSDFGSGTYFLETIKNDWTDLLNDMDVDLLLSGHTHQLFQFLPGMPVGTDLYYNENYYDSTKSHGYMTDADFPAFTVSRRSDVQTPRVAENLFGKKLIGMATVIDLDSSTMRCFYTNSDLEIVDIIKPFSGESVTEFDLTF